MIKATLVTIGAMLALQIAGVLAGIAIFDSVCETAACIETVRKAAFHWVDAMAYVAMFMLGRITSRASAPAGA